jgi:hypothetical protein
LDLILSTEPGLVEEVEIGCPIANSDHYTITFKIPIKRETDTKRGNGLRNTPFHGTIVTLKAPLITASAEFARYNKFYITLHYIRKEVMVLTFTKQSMYGMISEVLNSIDCEECFKGESVERMWEMIKCEMNENMCR